MATPWPRGVPPWGRLGKGAGGAPAPCPVPLYCVSWGRHTPLCSGAGGGLGAQMLGMLCPRSLQEVPKSSPVLGAGSAPAFCVTRPGLDNAGFAVVWDSGAVCGAWRLVRLWEAGRCFRPGPLCAVQGRIGHCLSRSEGRSGTGATVTLGGACGSEVTVQQPGGLCVTELGLLRLAPVPAGRPWGPSPRPALGALTAPLLTNRRGGAWWLSRGRGPPRTPTRHGPRGPPGVAGGARSPQRVGSGRPQLRCRVARRPQPFV